MERVRSGGPTEVDRHDLTTPEDDPGVVGWLGGQRQVRETPNQTGHGDLALHSGQRSTEAVVNAAAKRHVAVGVGPGHIQLVGGFTPEPGVAVSAA